MSQTNAQQVRRTSRRQFVNEFGTVVTGGWLARAVPWAAAGSALLWPRAADAATVLDPGNPGLFQTEGTQLFHPGEVLTLVDSSKSDFIVFFAFDTDAAPGTDLDVVTTFRVTAGVPVNADASNRVVINDGIARAAIAAATIRDGVRGIGLYSSGQPADQDAYPVFVPIDWTSAPVTMRLRRSANGDAEIVEVNGVAPSPRALLTADKAPAHTRAGASVEFGSASVVAECTVEYGAFRSERVALPVGGALGFTRFRIRDTDTADRIALRADFQLGAASNGIDPAVEPVTLQLSTPGCCAFYSRTLNGFTVHGKAPRRRWALSDAERARTGIEQFVIDEQGNGRGAVVLRDSRTTLFDDHFGAVSVAITIGTGAAADRLVGTARLEERRPGSGQWRLRGEV